MEQGAEQNKTEEPTPFKLKRARERGIVARGGDLGYFAVLCALAIFLAIAGKASIVKIGQAISRAMASAGASDEPPRAIASASALLWPAFSTIAALAGTAFLVVALFEIVQVRGLVFTTKPLKPDFGRLNPAKGLKRLFSMRMLKETFKSILKLIGYAAAVWLTLKYAFDAFAGSIDSAPQLATAMESALLRLLFSFILAAFFIVIIDQVIARREFLKQMRMSRSELTREHKEREGEPRLKHRRKQLHAEFASQTRALGAFAGSDMLIVNPEHFAVALAYDAARMQAPRVTAKGRNAFALQLKAKAPTHAIAIFERPALARALYRSCGPGDDIPASKYRDVADLYLQLMAARRKEHVDADRA